VGTTTLAVPAEQADEIVSVDAVYPIPLAPPHVLGLVAHRGRALPVLDLNEFLGLGEPARSPTLPAAGDLRARLIVVTGAGMSVGIRCDEARGIMELESSELQPAQAAWGERLRACAAAEVVHGGTLIVLLDLPRLLEAARIHE
jgi:purine-binding chemotaxis protein CheW